MRQIAVIACGALALGVKRIADRRGWPVDVHPLPAGLHNRPERIPAAVAAELERLRERYDELVVAYADCGTYGGLDELGVRRLAGDHCYDVLDRDAVRDALAEEPGTYLLTDFLARSFEHTVIGELGLDRHPELRDAYFSNYTLVLWLAERETAANRAAAERTAERLGLPLTVRPAGDGGLERELERLVSRSAGSSAR
jgi:Protein of unknown function (DUF1638)